MNSKLNFRNPFVQQYIFEILFPLIGYFFFDWSLVTIVLFYLVDQLASEISFLRRYRRTSSIQQRHTRIFQILLPVIGVLIIFFELTLLYEFFMNRGLQQEELWTELNRFLKDESWILIPVVVLMYYLKDQFTFFMPRRFLAHDSAQMYRMHLVSDGFIALMVALGSLLLDKPGTSDVLILVIFLGSKIIFDLTVQQWLDKKSLLKNYQAGDLQGS